MAKAHSEYDFIFLSVSHGFVKEAVEILRKNNVKGTLVFFCNFWDTRKEVEEWAGDYVYILAFPTAGGQMQDDHLDGVLFDHLMLEGEQKAHISNYTDLTALLTSADLKWEVLMIWSSGFGFTWRLTQVLLRQPHVREIWKIQKNWL